MATTTKPMAKTTKATDKKRAPRSTSRKSAENGDQKKHYRPAPSPGGWVKRERSGYALVGEGSP